MSFSSLFRFFVWLHLLYRKTQVILLSVSISMASGFFSFTSSDFRAIRSSHSFKHYGGTEHVIGVEAPENFQPFSWESGHLFQENIPNKTLYLDLPGHYQSNQQQIKSNPFKPGEFQFHIISPPVQSPEIPNNGTKIQQLETDEQRLTNYGSNDQQHRAESVNKMVYPSGLSSLELLSSYGNGFWRLKYEQFQIGAEKQTSSQKLSIEEIIRVASARYVQFSDLRYDDLSIVMHPFGYALSGLSEEEMKDVELVHLLLAAAEKVGYQQFERARKLLWRCELMASPNGNPVERIVFCFAEALRERIEKETGRVTAKKLDRVEGKNKSDHGLNLNTSSTLVRLYQRLPFLQATHFAGVQTVLDNVGTPRKLHLIDLEVRSGVQWTVLMQALVEQEKKPIELLKITAVAVESGREKIEETGLRLKTAAKSMNLPFSFHAVYVSDMTEIKESLFKIGDGEAIAVYCPLILHTMISRPVCLENLMRVVRNLNPSIMVVMEVEANHNSPVFVSRFVEALFFYSAFFDCLESCTADDLELRMVTELIFKNGIEQIVAMEGREREARSVKIDVWRAFFARFRMVEMGLSESSLYQAELVIKQFACAGYYTLEKNGKSVIVGWKGTPILSLSAWKFSRDRFRGALVN